MSPSTTTAITETVPIATDLDAVRQKYSEERQKRLRPDGVDQYHPTEGSFGKYVDDPYIVQPLQRAPLNETCDVVVIGGGYGGLLLAVKLIEAGVKDIRIIEKGADFGGTWYFNRYCGVACDIESYIYMPLLEETRYMPTEKYAHGPELLRHAQRIGHHFSLYDKTLFQTEVTGLGWDDLSGRWTVNTGRKDTIRARFVTSASGPLHKPKLPGVPGISDFKGHSFHTSRWDFDYTGGDTTGGLTNLADKTVGIIGTGATAIQVVPHLGKDARHLYVFQRTPSSVDYRKDGPTDYAWAKTLRPGWQNLRMEIFDKIMDRGWTGPIEDPINDGWTDMRKTIRSVMEKGHSIHLSQRHPPTKSAHTQSNGDADDALSRPSVEKLVQMADYVKMESIRTRIDQTVQDPAVAAKLKPWYSWGCKRPCFHDSYLSTFNRPNVTLVDTDGRGVTRITPKGVIVTDGDGAEVEYALDCLIFATGFEVGTDYAGRSGMEIIGRNGLSLSDKWRSGRSTLHGMLTRDFPNFFIISSGSQAGWTANFVHMTLEQARHIAYIVHECQERSIAAVEPTEEAELDWVNEIVKHSQAARRAAFCTPGYYNNEGKATEASIKSATYGLGPTKFYNLLEEWRANGMMKGLEIRRTTDGAHWKE